MPTGVGGPEDLAWSTGNRQGGSEDGPLEWHWLGREEIGMRLGASDWGLGEEGT
jgi:hypothetical protein